MKIKALVITCFLFLFSSARLHCQNMPGGGGSGKAERNEKNFSFVPIPYINYDRSLGLSVGALPMCMYNLSTKDTISPSSISGAFGMYTTNESWFTMVFNKFYVAEDKWRLTAVAGLGNINFQFFYDNPFNPTTIEYNTVVGFAMFEVQRKIYKSLYFGVNYTYMKYDTKFHVDLPINTEQTVILHGLGLVLSHDKRDDVYYPHKGYISNIKFKSYPAFMNETESMKLEIDYNKFIEMKNKKDILALRAYLGLGIGDLTFNQQFIVGGSDIRGYSQGEFRGNQKVTLQGEYRWNPLPKLGFVGFIGAAMVFNGINENDNARLLPGVGAGFRYLVFAKNHMNVGMDIAVGTNDWGLEFKIGESF
jgi:outer membrane protein assembly factor BamA